MWQRGGRGLVPRIINVYVSKYTSFFFSILRAVMVVSKHHGHGILELKSLARFGTQVQAKAQVNQGGLILMGKYFLEPVWVPFYSRTVWRMKRMHFTMDCRGVGVYVVLGGGGGSVSRKLCILLLCGRLLFLGRE